MRFSRLIVGTHETGEEKPTKTGRGEGIEGGSYEVNRP